MSELCKECESAMGGDMTEEIKDHPCLCDVGRVAPTKEEKAAIQTHGEASAQSGAFKMIRTDIRSANYGPNAMNNPPWGFLLHHTAGYQESDIPTLTRPGTGVSSNDYINKQGVIFELVPFPRRAWHAGTRDASQAGRYYMDGNTWYWGIEIENFGNGRDPYPSAQINALVWRCRQLRKRWPNIDHPEQIFRHRDFAPSRKVDPSNNFPFAEVKRRVLATRDPTDSDTPKPPPAPKPAPAPAPSQPAPSQPGTLYRVSAGGGERGSFAEKARSLTLAGSLLDSHDKVRIAKTAPPKPEPPPSTELFPAGTRWGVAGGRVVSAFGSLRPGAPAQRTHAGEDVAAPTGTPVHAMTGGVVVRSRNGGVSGYHQETTVEYDVSRISLFVEKIYVLYGHLLRDSLLPVGAAVARGTVIGRVGTSADAMGTTPHAHVQMWVSRDKAMAYDNASAQDPEHIRAAMEPRIVPAAGNPAPSPAPAAPSGAAKAIDDYFGSLRPAWSGVPYRPIGAALVEEARRAGVALQAACALVEQESAGRNVFGCDHGPGADRPPYCHQAVASGRVAALRASGKMNGVGTTQLTWHTFVTEAERLGGAHVPRNQMRVGLRLLADYFRRFGEADGYGAYNAGEANRASVRNTYSAACVKKSRAWRSRLGPHASANGEGDIPEPTIEEDDMQPRPSRRRQSETRGGGLPAAAKAVVAAAVPLLAALILWAATGTLDETELSVGLTGLLTALLVYFVPNTPGPEDPPR